MSNKDRLKRIAFIIVHNPRQFLFLLMAKVRSFFILRKSPFDKVLKGGVIFRFDFDYDPQIKSMYLGTYEIETVEVIKKILKKGDTFIDVGANIGYLSTIALGLVGEKGSVHSFEPVQEYFLKLKDITFLNKGYNFIVNNCALGEIEGIGKIAVTNLQNIGWNTMVPGFMPSQTIRQVQEVTIRRLDSYIKKKVLNNIALIKIDAEGFEFPVLKGLSKYFEASEYRPTIICEIVASAYSLLGYQLKELVQYMDEFKYSAFKLSNPKKRIDVLELQSTTNVLFLSQQ